MTITATAELPAAVGLQLSRKALLTALERAQAVVPGRCYKPIFSGVRLMSLADELQISATDGEIMLLTTVAAEGALPTCVVPCSELIRLLRASRESSTVLAVRVRPQRLIVNGGRVEHALHTLPLDDFPPVATRWEGQKVLCASQELHEALTVASRAMAKEASRYAISGLLLESDDEGIRLVATDGRRLVTVALRQAETKFRGQALLPARLVKLMLKFTASEKAEMLIAVQPKVNDKGESQPADVYVASGDWLLATRELEGRFPLYRDVMPQSHSRFAVDRRLLAETLKEVGLATGDCSRNLQLVLRPKSIELSAAAPETGSASAKLPARFLGGGDSLIYTAFNPGFLLEAIQTVPGAQVILDVDQNGLGRTDGKVFSKPALIYGAEDDRIRWVVMPVSMDYPATRTYLGSNFPAESADAA